MKDYIPFKTTSSFYSNQKISFSNDYGKNPFILYNNLYIPKEMLKDEYQKNFGFESKANKQNYQNPQNKNKINSFKPTGLINYGASVC